MPDAWQTLRDAGLPLAMPAAAGPPRPDDIARAVLEVIGDAGDGREADALAAFVLGWAHHWPSSFAAAFGARADRTRAWAGERASKDLGRYVKLRRIAIENLAHVL